MGYGSSKQYIAGLVTLIFFTPLLADSNHLYLGGIVGGSIAEIGNKNPQIEYYNNYLLDEYSMNGQHNTQAIMGIDGGYEWKGKGRIPAIAFGLGLYGTPWSYHYDGQLIETAAGDPSDTLYDFNFTINNIRLMVETQFTWIFNLFSPFINVGVGSVWNLMRGYSETPADSIGYVALPPFQSNTNTNFAYQIGVGISHAFNFKEGGSNVFKNERFSLGYRYVNLGDASFETRGNVYPYSLDLGVLTANEFYFNYTHLF